MPRPIHATVDTYALQHNLNAIRRMTDARVMAVIKANGYGHGLMRVAEALREADGFALLDIQDAIKLREAGYRQTILLLEGIFDLDDLPTVLEYDLACVVHSDWQLEMLDACPSSAKLNVWLKINSGMNRLGFTPTDAQQVWLHLRRHRAVHDVTLMSHFANADEEEGISDQLHLFNGVVANMRAKRSLANSAAILRYPESHADWVRPGVMLYGASPFANKTAAELGLRSVMTLKSEIIAVQTLQSGDSIGYGSTFRAEGLMRVGIVACGYADGYPRHAQTGTPVMVDECRTKLLGRVSMDMLAVDLTHIPQARVGCPVVLWGENLPIEEVAHSAGTISYELMCAIASRVSIKTK